VLVAPSTGYQEHSFGSVFVYVQVCYYADKHKRSNKQMEPRSILAGVNEHDVVTVHNPLDTEFTGRVARSVVTRAQSSPQHQTGNSQADAFLSQIKPDGPGSVAHVQQQIVLQPGQTMRMPGDVARVVVRQLVKELMQRKGAKKRMADPMAVMQFEKEVVLDHQNMLENMSVESAEQRLTRQLDELNDTPQGAEKVAASEPAFPTEPEPAADAGKPKSTAAAQPSKK